MLAIIKEHLRNYPNMQLQDVAKLLHQSEFGGGHMISDKEKSLKWIQEEYNSLTLNTLESLPLTEAIGDGIYRIYLSNLKRGLRAEVLNEMFVQSAEHKKGSIEGLEAKIETVKQKLPFPDSEVQSLPSATRISTEAPTILPIGLSKNLI